jgi:hypothetical protein
MAHEFPLVRHFGNLPKSSLRFGKEYQQTSALGRQRPDALYLAKKITLAQFETAVSQQAVRGCHMKIEVRQHKAQ